MNGFPPWLQSSWDFLLERKKNKTLPHALLFTGNKGVGKYELSIAFSRYLLCHTEQSCGQCHGCVLFSAGHHPDFFVLMPEEQGQIKIDQIRQITEKLNYTAQQGSYRIVVIKEAHAMNTAAANALLKTLEESVIALAHDLLEEPLDEVLLLFQLAFMELIKVKTNFKTAEELKNIAEKFSLKKLFSCYNFIINLRLKINSNVNLNAQLLLENIFLKIRQESVHVG